MSSSPAHLADWAVYEAKMKSENLSQAAILSFRNSYLLLRSGASGMIPEADISPATGVPLLTDLQVSTNADLLDETVVLKLNGGLGTGMGLDYAKSLLQVKGTDTFLDLTAKQVLAMRKDLGKNVKFMLMNSFSTSEDTMAFLAKYPDLTKDDIEFVQNKVPKVDQNTWLPAEWALNPHNEWCPPGHGDLYAALDGSGTLDRLLASGAKYMFVSNSDNLGATLDTKLLSYFAHKDAPFMMECCTRTDNDKKGGHLAVRKSDSQLILRESAQCPDEDEAKFQDIGVHTCFNTNNLWVRLDKLRELIDASGGLIKLPMIKNAKTVDPKDGASTAVFQLETAMGAAIECFAGACAVVVPRTRFAPVKKCHDLLLLRSDAYALVDNIPVLQASKAPTMAVDSKKYKIVEALELATAAGTPSLIDCTSFTVKGYVLFSRGCVFRGAVTIINGSDEAKPLAPGVYENTTVDLTAAPSLGPLAATKVATKPFAGQKPGTSGLRKKTKVFMEGSYLHNFVQSTFAALKASGTDVTAGTLVVGGDGRYYNDVAIQVIVKIAAANGVKRIWLGQHGYLSTPAASAVIRENRPSWQKPFGAFILTASHNPGGPEEDFGIKYNCENGGPAPEGLTDAIYKLTTTCTAYWSCEALPAADLAACGSTTIVSSDGGSQLNIQVIDTVKTHVDLLATVFDFGKLRALVARPDFDMVYDCMHGVQGPYAHACFVDALGCDAAALINAVPKDDFNGGHADPNLTYAKDLTKAMGVDRTGLPVGPGGAAVPAFGAAADGDADRNMILGRQFFVTPSDSVAIIAAHADKCIPFFASQGGLKAVARSMPTSGALDRVAKALNLALFETPTGWKYFGNLMDSKALFGGTDYTPFICGEESFGTGSDHVREKDGLWAVLAWMSILAFYNDDASAEFVSVQSIVEDHWKKYGRNYYCRYDYEGVDKPSAVAMVDAMSAASAANTGRTVGAYTIETADVFEYTDPVDGSVATNQGIRFLMTDGSRVIFRLSGTAGSGATVRMYLENYQPTDISQITGEMMGPLVAVALELSQLKKFTGVESPTVIT